MEYGPAPEAAGPAIAWLEAHERDASATSSTARGSCRGREHFESINPATGQNRSRASRRRSRAEVDAAVAAARARAAGLERRSSGHERARYLYALARQVQKHSRLLAVLETLDNGKPIRETRDIDIPLVARHFYHHAGWAQLHGARVRRATSRSASSARSSRGTSRC